MGDVIAFKRPAKKPAAGNTLCKEGHHKWVIDKEKQFDSKQGRLVTLFKCSRCGKKKTELL